MPSASSMLTAADLRFDPETHTTLAPDGRLVPHVTEVLGAVGVATDFDELIETSPRLAGAIEHARARGTAVHADCHAYDDDDLVVDSMDPRIRPYVLDAWAPCRAALGLVPVLHARERQVFDPANWFTGIMDGIFKRPALGDWFVLVDVKTGDPDDAAAHLQTAAYETAARATFPGQRIHERWAIQLMPGRRVPWRVTNYSHRADAYQDGSKWLACLCTYNEQPGRRRSIK